MQRLAQSSLTQIWKSKKVIPITWLIKQMKVAKLTILNLQIAQTRKM